MTAIFKNIVRFECQQDCSNCCTISGGFVFLTEIEASGIAAYLKMKEDEFLNHFTRIVDDKLAFEDGENDACVFLENGCCLIYDYRPEQCRTYPFWPQNMKSKARWELTKEECPGIGKGPRLTDDDIKDILKGKSLNSQKQ